MKKRTALETSLRVELIDDERCFTIAELCRACAIDAELVERLVDEGIIEPVGKEGHHLQFSGNSLRRTRISVNLQRDLGVNLAGVALALELLERIEQLDSRLQRLQRRQ